MNEAASHPPQPLSSAPDSGWTPRRFYFWIGLALLAHVGLLFVFDTRKPIAPRDPSRVPQWHLAEPHSELLSLMDPTLFALPNARDFASALWQQPARIAPPAFDYTEATQFLPLPAKNLGAAFAAFVRTNAFPEYQFDFKPAPPVTAAEEKLDSPLPQSSSLEIAGGLAARPVLHPIAVPAIPCNEVLNSSRVQILVDAAGNVFSTALLESSDLEGADQTALTLSRALRFAPAEQPVFGELIFHWHTQSTP